MAEEQQQQQKQELDENKRIRPRERARGQKLFKSITHVTNLIIVFLNQKLIFQLTT